jgi:hypothetical protein
MSNKLYVFGCSYAWTTYEPRSWPYRLAKHFNLTLENKGFPGFGILQTFESWKLLEKDMKPGDMNVVCLSHPDRTYFFADAPFYSQLGHAESSQIILDNLEDRISKKIKKVKSTYIDYYLHLHRQEHYLWLVECWLRWLDTKSKELGTKTIVIPAFVELLPVLNGDFKNLLILKKPLMEISQGEYGDVRCKEIFDGKYDLRSNHLCISNHNVLLSKILDGIKLGYISDSMSDWHTGLINPENFLIPDWHSTEFCYTKFDDKFFYPDNIYNNIVKEIINGIKSN